MSRIAMLAVLAAGVTSGSACAQTNPRVLAIGIDGLRADALVAANTPNIDSLLDGSYFGTAGPSGMFAHHGQAEHLTFSGPGWGSFMTGMHVDRHGADTNGFENTIPGITDWFTPLETHNPALDTHRVITWEIAHTSIPSGADTSAAYEYDQVVGGQNGDDRMTDHVVGLMQTASTDAVMMFYSDPDVAGHTYGFDPTNTNYLSVISEVDSQIGQVMNAISARSNFDNEDWLVIITSDHGGAPDGTHAGGTPEKRTIPFIVAGPHATTVLPQAHPRLVDVANTVLDYFGAPIPAQQDGYAVGLSAAGPSQPAFDTNIIFNGDAEYDRGFAQNGMDQYVSGWNDPGPDGINVVFYGSPHGFPSPTSPGPDERGNNFFSGGLNATSEMTQRIELGQLAAAIDSGQVDFELSAWLGGYINQDDRADFNVTFLAADGSTILGSATLQGPDANDRGNVTALIEVAASGDLAVGTRFVEFTLNAMRPAAGENDGFADNLSFILRHSNLTECDFNGDGFCNAPDIDMLGVEVIAGTHRAPFDLTGDGNVDLNDRDAFLALAATENGFDEPFQLGDADLNGVTDGQDFLAWNANKFGTSNPTAPWSEGDFTLDNVVDGEDFLAWNTNKFNAISDGTRAVPEPVGGMVLLILSSIHLLRASGTNSVGWGHTCSRDTRKPGLVRLTGFDFSSQVL